MSRTVAEHIALDASAILTLTDNEPGADLALPRQAGNSADTDLRLWRFFRLTSSLSRPSRPAILSL